MNQPEYYYNTKTGEVEVGKESSWMNLMGPYASEEEARNALKTAQERNEQADAEEKAWEDDWDDDNDDN